MPQPKNNIDAQREYPDDRKKTKQSRDGWRMRNVVEDGPAGFNKGVAIARDLVASGAVRPDDKATAANIASDLINAGFSDKDIGFITSDLAASKKVSAANLVGVGGNLAKLQRQFGESDLESTTARLLSAAAASKSHHNVAGDYEVRSVGGSEWRQPQRSGGGVRGERETECIAGSGCREFEVAVLTNLPPRARQWRPPRHARQHQSQGERRAFSILGDANAVSGYLQLTQGRAQLDAYEAQFGGAAFDRTNLLATDPILRAAQLKSQAIGRGAATTEAGRSENELLLDTLYEEQRQAGEARGEWFPSRWLRSAQFGFADMFGMEEGFMASQGRKTISGFGGALSPAQGSVPGASADLSQAILDRLDRIAENTGSVDRITRSKVATRPNEP
jgi:hypothetical protein